jgi:hypothetical protein
MENMEEKENKENEGFREMLERSLAGERRRLRPGEKQSVRIVKITPEWVFVDLGGKTEGIIDRSELVGEDGSMGVRGRRTPSRPTSCLPRATRSDSPPGSGKPRPEGPISRRPGETGSPWKASWKRR